MTSTVLHGLDDEDIPQDFVDELAEAEWLERKADAAVLLNALLLAGWTPPSAPASQDVRREWQACGRGICAAEEGHLGPCVKG